MKLQVVLKQQVMLLGFVFLLTSTHQLSRANAAGECPRSTPDTEAMKLFSCISAAQDPKTAVPRRCCSQVSQVEKNPRCLCAVLLSNMLKRAGINPAVAITIPKRCNLKRPVGYKCGAYILP